MPDEGEPNDGRGGEDGSVGTMAAVKRETAIAELEQMSRGAKEVLDRERRAMNERVCKITQYLQSIVYSFVLR